MVLLMAAGGALYGISQHGLSTVTVLYGALAGVLVGCTPIVAIALLLYWLSRR
ncbi:hypothetical protein [Vogesella indigofera]|uniref:hypothetical protein n=1 Tax=Vogesella indigofera TaxID=45465 RepID=UPI00138DF680|nr:hypothetical protein [Vogesella indigofera]